MSRYAQAIECPWVLVVPGPTDGRTDAQVTSDTVATLREMADAAAEFGISVAFEFMGFPWAAVRDVTGAWAIVQQANRPNLGIIVDTAHFYAGGSTLESIREVDPERLVVLHINDVEDVAKPDITDGYRLYPVKASFPSRTSSVPFVRPGGMECCQSSYSVRSTGSRIRWPWPARQKPRPSRYGSVRCAVGGNVMAEVQPIRV